ncbi:hypothetical protein ACFX13_025288 [Malus domestica]
MAEDPRAIVSWRSILSLNASCCALIDATDDHESLWTTAQLNFSSNHGIRCNFAYVPMLLKHPLAILACVPKDVALFAARAIAGAAAESVTAPLDRIKILMQTHRVRVGQQSANQAISFLEAITMIGKEERIKGYWKGNLP